MNMAVDQIHSLKDANKSFSIFMVPRTTVLCEDLLEKEQLANGTEKSFFCTLFFTLSQVLADDFWCVSALIRVLLTEYMANLCLNCVRCA